MNMTVPAARSKLSLYLDLIRWDRPAGTLLLLWPTLSALWIAAGGSAKRWPSARCSRCSRMPSC
jgi:4-hydroxybenzoate polyprenyltransferase